MAEDPTYFSPSGFPLDCVAIQFNVWNPLESIGMLLAIPTYAHNAKKGEQETKVLSVKKFWKIAPALVNKPGGFEQ